MCIPGRVPPTALHAAQHIQLKRVDEKKQARGKWKLLMKGIGGQTKGLGLYLVGQSLLNRTTWNNRDVTKKKKKIVIALD